ncbi:MAG: hypothetical protein ACE5OZ_07420 [Candidatus Heimdallarchaeota archaeon]
MENPKMKKQALYDNCAGLAFNPFLHQPPESLDPFLGAWEEQALGKTITTLVCGLDDNWGGWNGKIWERAPHFFEKTTGEGFGALFGRHFARAGSRSQELPEKFHHSELKTQVSRPESLWITVYFFSKSTMMDKSHQCPLPAKHHLLEASSRGLSPIILHFGGIVSFWTSFSRSFFWAPLSLISLLINFGDEKEMNSHQDTIRLEKTGQ